MGLANTLGTVMQTAGTAASKAINNAASSVASFKNMGSGMANAVSAAAQQNQFDFNSAEALLQRQNNEDMWRANSEFNAAQAALANQWAANQAELTREFNAEEAQKNRDWQERMSNTQYQRAVTDLKKAGLNPVLAALNGGAYVGSGATASGSNATTHSASAGYSSGAAASGSTYTGQGSNISDSLALMGAIGSIIGNGISALGAYMVDKQDQADQRLNSIYEGYNNLKENVKDWYTNNRTHPLYYETEKNQNMHNYLQRKYNHRVYIN